MDIIIVYRLQSSSSTRKKRKKVKCHKMLLDGWGINGWLSGRLVGGVVGQYNKAQTFIHDTRCEGRYRKSIPAKLTVDISCCHGHVPTTPTPPTPPPSSHEMNANSVCHRFSGQRLLFLLYSPATREARAEFSGWLRNYGLFITLTVA